MAVVGPAVFDCQIVNHGSPVEHSFVLHNQSKQPIEILGIRTSCTCTAAATEAGSIAPGEKAIVRLSIKSFDVRRIDFSEAAFVRHTAGETRLTMIGRLSSPSEIVYRPKQIVWLNDRELSEESGEQLTRLIHVRIPKTLVVPIDGDSVRWRGKGKMQFEVRQQADCDPLYAEYIVSASVDAANARTTIGKIEIEAGQQKLVIEVGNDGTGGRP